jgi:hypothetical protein
MVKRTFYNDNGELIQEPLGIYKKYLTEMSSNYKTLFNIVAVARTRKDLDYAKDTIEKAKKKGVIKDKEYNMLNKEIMDLKKHM